MTIQLPDRLDLHQEGEETTALTLVASEDAVQAALRRLRADGAAARAAGVEPREALRELRGRDFRVRDRPDREAKDSDIRTKEFRRVVGL